MQTTWKALVVVLAVLALAIPMMAQEPEDDDFFEDEIAEEESGVEEIVGVVEATEWDDNYEATAIALAADSGYYVIELNRGLGRRLLSQVDRTVKVKGEVEETEVDLTVVVTSYSVLSSSTE